MARPDTDVQEDLIVVIDQRDIGRIVEAPAFGHARRRIRCRTELGKDTAGHEIRERRAVENVETPDLPAHVGRIHTVGEAVRVEVDDANVAGDRILHGRQVTIRGRIRGMPEQRARFGVDDIDRIPRSIGIGDESVVRRMVCAGADMDDLRSISTGRRRRS